MDGPYTLCFDLGIWHVDCSYKKERRRKMKKLDIYKVIDGKDDWPLVETLLGETNEEVLHLADMKYGLSEKYHWTNPY